MLAPVRIPEIFKNSVFVWCLAILLIAGGTKLANADNRADEVTERIVALLKGYGASEVSFSSTSYDSVHDEVTITDLKIVGPSDELTVVEADELVLNGAKTPDDGTLSADSIIVIAGSGRDEDGEQLSFRRLTELEVFIPTKAMIDDEGDAITYSMMREAVIEYLVVGNDPKVPVKRIHYSRGALDGQVPTSFSIKVEGIAVDIADLDDEDAQEALRELGYDKLDMDMAVDWQWDRTTGNSGVSPVRITVTDAGGYEFHTEFGGITYELLTASNTETAMQHVEQITLKSAELVYNDNSAMDRMMAYGEREADVDRTGVIAIWLSKIRDGLTEAGAPESFNAMVLRELEIFLNDPQKLSVSLKPSQPVPASQIVGSIMFGPGVLIPLLNILVTAN
ncbi:MAG: hypothetical protein K8F25_16075 [Fimbriimonadaceae bacterium]|nr:hypothetical protein [Alphaproteobacteria bacterium]